MKIFRQILSGALALALAISTPMLSLADEGLGGNTNSGGNAAAGSDAVYAHKFMIYPENQGYRISIVDQTGDRVTNSVDIVNYIPTDINNIGHGNSNNGGGRQEFIDGYNKYINWLGWSDYTGKGLNKKNAFYYSNGIKTEEFTRKTWGFGGVPTHANSKGELVETNMYPKGKFEEYLATAYNLKVADLTEKGYEGLVPISEDKPFEIPLPSILNASKTGFDPGGEILMETFKSTVGKVGQEQDDTSKTEEGSIAEEKKATYNVLSLLVDMALTIYNNQGQSTGRVDHLFRFTDPQEQARVGKEEIHKITGKEFIVKPSDIITENSYKVVVEPLYWYVPEILSIHPDLLAMTNGSINYASVNGVCYGTVSYLARYAYEIATGDGKDELGIEDDKMHLSWTGPNWGTSDLGATTLMLAYTDEELGIYEPSVAPEPLAQVAGRDEWSLHSMAYGNNYKEVGYAAHIYDNLLMTDLITNSKETSTFDEKTCGDESDTGYRPGPSEDTSERGGKEAKNNIVKFYSKKNNGNYIYISNFTRENTIGKIEIEHEFEGGYMVDDWFTSPTFRKPTNNTDDYGNWKSSLENKQTGTSEGNVALNKNETLYVRLVEVPEVTKIYESNGATDKVVVDNNPQFENGSLIVTTPDEGYNYVEAIESPENADPDSWQDVPAGNSTTDTRIPVKDTTKEIFIHYQKPDAAATGLVLHENEISHQFKLSDVTGSLVEGVQNWSSVSSDASCPEDVGDEDDYESCGASYDYTGSEDWSFGIENQPNYNTQFVYKWIQLEPKSWTGGGLSESGGSGKGTPNMTMILQRSISDKVTLYPSKNSNKAALNDMGITSEGYIPANTRKDSLKDVPSRKSWTETFNTNFEFVDVNTPTATFESDHGYTDTDNHTDAGNNASSLNGTYSKSGNTTIYGLWGKENKGDRALNDPAQQNIWKLSSLNFRGFKNHVKEQAFTFYPYYKMKFISELDGAEQDAYLTAENLSTLFSLQRIDTSIFRPKGATTLELTSSQWSTHAKAHNLLDAAGVENKNSLLPAGAIYDLRTAGNGVKASQSWIGYRVFNSYVMDKNALADATNVKTKQEVVDAVNAFKNDTKNVLSNYEVVMVGQEGINKDDNNGEFYRGSEVITGKDGSYRLGQEFIRDSKYDLQTTGSASGNSSDIDVLEELEETYDWVLTSDADGNVVITRNGTELERLQKNQKNLTNAEVKEFDSRTNIVTNFLSAIDRNMGSDRNGKTWYNEGFSIGCLETRLAYRMGFGDGDASLRSTALNIKANGKLENRNDMFNGDEAKNRSYQFFTSARSTLNGCEKDYVGTYDGIKIFIPNMNQLLVSNRFYTSNTTVMDLN